MNQSICYSCLTELAHSQFVYYNCITRRLLMVQSNESTNMFIDCSIMYLGACFVDDAAHSFESIIKIVLWPHGSYVTCKTTTCSKWFRCHISFKILPQWSVNISVGIYLLLLTFVVRHDCCHTRANLLDA